MVAMTSFNAEIRYHLVNKYTSAFH